MSGKTKTAEVNEKSVSSVSLTIPGMGSDHCAGIVRTSLERLDGVGEIKTSIAAHRARVAFDPARLTPGDLKSAIERAGYEVDTLEEGRVPGQDRDSASEERHLARAWKRLWIDRDRSHDDHNWLSWAPTCSGSPSRAIWRSSRCWPFPSSSPSADGPPMSRPGGR